MAIEFKLPELGENIEGGDIINVLIKEGDNVAEGQSILEVEVQSLSNFSSGTKILFAYP